MKLPREFIANVLPASARDALIRASQVEGPRARQIAIEKATQRIKFQHPEFFHIPKEQQQ